MTHPLHALGRSSLAGLADALATGRLAPPFARGTLAHHVPEGDVDAIGLALDGLVADGMLARHIAVALRLLVDEREAEQRSSDRLELVCSPPELDRVDARDTAVVVRELFRKARASVLIATFALDEKKQAEALFGELAARMDRELELVVRVFANVHRKRDDDRVAAVLVREFATKMRDQIWPGERLPEVFYDPRSLETEGNKRAVLHAKVVVADDRWTLLTSANFTEAAQERNIEAGVVVDDARLAGRVTRQFDLFVAEGILRPLPLSSHGRLIWRQHTS